MVVSFSVCPCDGLTTCPECASFLTVFKKIISFYCKNILFVRLAAVLNLHSESSVKNLAFMVKKGCVHEGFSSNHYFIKNRRLLI